MENRFFKVGGAVSPLSGSVGSSTLLRDADPVLHKMLDFFPAVIRLHCEERWNEEVAACGLSELSGSMVAQALPYDPLPLAAENAWRFPLFAAYPVESLFTEKTKTWYRIQRKFQVLYMLPPLSAEQSERLHPFLAHVERVLVDRLMEGLDEDYNNGEAVWSHTGLDYISVHRSTFGKVPGVRGGLSSDIYLPCVSLDIEVGERRKPADENFVLVEGLLSGSIDLAMADEEEETVTDFIVVTEND